MVYVYKNFFIVEREEKIQKASQLVHELKASFNDDEHIWRAKSPLDKVVLVYKHPLINDDNVHSFTREEEIRFSLNEYIGYIHVYCQGTNIRITNFKINLMLNAQEQYWRTYKQYLVKTIQQSGVLPMQLNQIKFTLYWARLSGTVMDFMERMGLLSDRSKKTYVFTSEDINPTGFGTPSVFGGFNQSPNFGHEFNAFSSGFGSTFNGFNSNWGNR